MARKGKKKGRAKFRPHLPPTHAAAVTTAPPRAVPQARVGGDQALVRAVEMSLGPGRPLPQRGRGARGLPESSDPAIPLERVPYFLPDLRKLAVVGAAMVVLLFLGSFLIPLVIR